MPWAEGVDVVLTDAVRAMSVADIRDRARVDAGEILARHSPPGVLPVDPVAVARSLGLSVFSAELGEDVFGMLVGNGGGADIYLDRDQPPRRFRFSCAHEIGHYVLRAGDINAESAFVDRRSDGGRGTADEIYANEFAGFLLMPESELRDAVARGLGDYDLAARFGVSLDAIRYRRSIVGV